MLCQTEDITVETNEIKSKNREIPAGAAFLPPKIREEGEEILFALVGDLNLAGAYAETAVFFTASALWRYDGVEGEFCRYAYSDLSEVQSKRMYGNATLSALLPDGRREILFRYTYSIAALCEASAQFISQLNDGASLEDQLAVMEASIEHAISVCPKCGRQLLHPGAECIMCRSKTKIAKRLFAYIKPQMGTLTFCILLAFITTFMALIPPAITGYIVDVVFPGGKGSSNVGFLNMLTAHCQNDAGRMLSLMILLLLVTYLLQYSIGVLRSYLMRCVGHRAVAAMRIDVYRQAQLLPMRFYDKTSTGSVINRIAGDCNTIKDFMLRITQEAVVHLFQMIGIIVIMISMNPTLTLYSLIPVPIIVVLSRIFSKKIRPFYVRIWRRWSAVFSTLADVIPCIKVVKSFTGEDRSSDLFEKKNDEWLQMDLRLGKIATAFPQIVSFFITCGSLMIWAIGGTKVISGESGYSAGLIVSFISYASMFYTPVSFFANLTDSYQNTLSSTEKVLDILEAEPEVQAPDAIKPGKLKGEIEFKHVSFSFDRTKKVLDNVSFKIAPGEVVGIVGTTGSGKSTLINLLMRFYDGYSGKILVDGTNIKKFDLSAYREQVGYVQQEPQMFSDTIFNNIAYGRPDATMEEVIAAADAANAHGFICRQPDAYDTMLGERGVGVSGGEKQRISIARAVLKQPSLMIFDEATAAVDSETERLIQDAIDHLIEGKTTLMIAHRLSTLRHANRILVVDNGHIIENGSPEELMALKGKYYKLVQIQSMVAESERMKEEENF